MGEHCSWCSGGARADHDEPGPRVHLADPAGEFVASHARHEQVKGHEVGSVAGHEVESLLPAPGLAGRPAPCDRALPLEDPPRDIVDLSDVPRAACGQVGCQFRNLSFHLFGPGLLVRCDEQTMERDMEGPRDGLQHLETRTALPPLDETDMVRANAGGLGNGRLGEVAAPTELQDACAKPSLERHDAKSSPQTMTRHLRLNPTALHKLRVKQGWCQFVPSSASGRGSTLDVSNHSVGAALEGRPRMAKRRATPSHEVIAPYSFIQLLE